MGTPLGGVRRSMHHRFKGNVLVVEKLIHAHGHALSESGPGSGGQIHALGWERLPFIPCELYPFCFLISGIKCPACPGSPCPAAAGMDNSGYTVRCPLKALECGVRPRFGLRVVLPGKLPIQSAADLPPPPSDLPLTLT